jgi:hypothetical protein
MLIRPSDIQVNGKIDRSLEFCGVRPPYGGGFQKHPFGVPRLRGSDPPEGGTPNLDPANAFWWSVRANWLCFARVAPAELPLPCRLAPISGPLGPIGFVWRYWSRRQSRLPVGKLALFRTIGPTGGSLSGLADARPFPSVREQLALFRTMAPGSPAWSYPRRDAAPLPGHSYPHLSLHTSNLKLLCKLALFVQRARGRPEAGGARLEGGASRSPSPGPRPTWCRRELALFGAIAAPIGFVWAPGAAGEPRQDRIVASRASRWGPRIGFVSHDCLCPYRPIGFVSHDRSAAVSYFKHQTSHFKLLPLIRAPLITAVLHESVRKNGFRHPPESP